MAVYLRSKYRAAGSNLISDHADATAPPTGPPSPSSPDLAPRLSPARGGRTHSRQSLPPSSGEQTLPRPPPPPPPLPGGGRAPPYPPPLGVTRSGGARERGGAGWRRECGCAFGFGARSRWRQEGGGETELSGLWLGPGRALGGGVGKAGGGRRERWAWFENFRIKNSWGLELAEEGSLIKNGAAALGSGHWVEVDLVFSPPFCYALDGFQICII